MCVYLELSKFQRYNHWFLSKKIYTLKTFKWLVEFPDQVYCEENYAALLAMPPQHNVALRNNLPQQPGHGTSRIVIIKYDVADSTCFQLSCAEIRFDCKATWINISVFWSYRVPSKFELINFIPEPPDCNLTRQVMWLSHSFCHRWQKS